MSLNVPWQSDHDTSAMRGVDQVRKNVPGPMLPLPVVIYRVGGIVLFIAGVVYEVVV